jgi:4-hydroxybenzoate polyprenyltransferase
MKGHGFMAATAAPLPHSVLRQLKLFFALSRTPHGALDIATPAVAALLWHGSFPPLGIILLGLITAFAGYTAVYALNDLADHRVDRKKLAGGGFTETKNYLDAVLIRHPVACGRLTFKEGLWWTVGWALLALAGSYLLNPVCALIFLIACSLETIYCLLWETSLLRVFISGAVKTSGGIAAVFAMDPTPSCAFLILLFFWLFFWEIGGQNIPADWTDSAEDRLVQAKTIPLQLGPGRAIWMILSSLIFAMVLNTALLGLSHLETKLPAMVAAACVGLYLLLLPAYGLFREQEESRAAILFNKASYYPLAILVIVGFVTVL